MTTDGNWNWTPGDVFAAEKVFSIMPTRYGNVCMFPLFFAICVGIGIPVQGFPVCSCCTEAARRVWEVGLVHHGSLEPCARFARMRA